MEINLTPIRGTILAVLLVIFYYYGGFDLPGEFNHHRFNRAWGMCIAIFCTGAVMASIVDHWVGNVDRSNLRLLYIIFGIILMACALFWQSILRAKVESLATLAPWD